MKRLIFVVVVLAIAGAVGWKIYGKARESASGDQRGRTRGVAAVAVETVALERGAIRDVRTFSGALQADSRFIAAPKISGRVEELLVDIGDTVERNQLLARLDDAELRQQVEQARAELAVAEASTAETLSRVREARRELDRADSLRERRVTPQSDLDAAQAEYDAMSARHEVALAVVERRRAELRAAEIRLTYTEIRAAWPEGDGRRVVGERYCDEGETLKANDPIVSILDMDPLTAVIYVIERDYSLMAPGQRAELSTDAWPGRLFGGTVTRVAPVLRETSREARVEIEAPNTEGLLKPGMFVRARIEFQNREDVLLAPVDALARRDEREGVFLVDEAASKVRFVPVETGIVEGERFEVREPALSGRVVTLGRHLLEDGAAVRLPEAAAPAVSPGGAPAPAEAKTSPEKAGRS